jgi:hypothetical protein
VGYCVGLGKFNNQHMGGIYMGTVFGVFSVLAWVIGMFNVNGMTTGVFCAATACWLAILVRTHEARKQHDALMERLGPKP